MMHRSEHLWRLATSGGVGVCSFAAYLRTLPPGLTWAHDSADGGLLAAAAYTLGIAHPPAHPTYVLLAYPFAHLGLPTTAQGTNLFSAVCTALAAALVCRSVPLACAVVSRRLALPCRTAVAYVAGAGAGLLFAFCPLAWSMATVTEVHALNGLFAALLVVLALHAEQGRSAGRRRASALALGTGAAFGLALGNHPIALLATGPLVLTIVMLLARSLGAWRVARIALLGTGLGLSVYLLLPLRALASPAINWGDPRTPQRFWSVVTCAPYRAYVFGVAPAYLPARASRWANLLLRQLTPVGLLLAIAGTTLSQHSVRTARAAAAATALVSAFAIGYDTTDSYQYLLAVLPYLASGTGVGVCVVVWRLTRGRRWGAWLGLAVSGAALIATLVLGAARLPAQDLRSDRSALGFAASTLGTAPPHAVIITQKDAYTFALWYYQFAEGMREDVVIVDTGLLGEAWYNAAIVGQLGPWPDGLDMPTGPEPAGWAFIGRPVCQVSETSSGRRFSLVCTD